MLLKKERDLLARGHISRQSPVQLERLWMHFLSLKLPLFCIVLEGLDAKKERWTNERPLIELKAGDSISSFLLFPNWCLSESHFHTFTQLFITCSSEYKLFAHWQSHRLSQAKMLKKVQLTAAATVAVDAAYKIVCFYIKSYQIVIKWAVCNG